MSSCLEPIKASFVISLLFLFRTVTSSVIQKVETSFSLSLCPGYETILSLQRLWLAQVFSMRLVMQKKSYSLR